MSEIEAKVIQRLDKLASATDTNPLSRWLSTALIAFLAVVGFLLFFTSTKPADVLRSTQEIDAKTARLEEKINSIEYQVTELYMIVLKQQEKNQ